MSLHTGTLFHIEEEAKPVKTSNDFVTARYEMTVLQSRVFGYLLDQVRPDDEPDKEYLVRVKDILPREVGKAYHSRLRKAVRGLQMTIISFPHPDRPNREVDVQLAGRSEYEDGYAVIRLDNLLRRTLLDLRRGWTDFQLDHLFRIQSEYGWRFYLFFSRHGDRGEWRISVEDLRRMLRLTDRCEYTPQGPKPLPDLYPAFKDFRKWVLDAAMNDLKTNVGVVNPSYVVLDQDNQPLPEGRGVRGRKATYLYFTWGANGKGPVPKGIVPDARKRLRAPKPVAMDKTTSKMLASFYGLSRGQIQYLRTYPDQAELKEVAIGMQELYPRAEQRDQAQTSLLQVLRNRGKGKGWSGAWAGN